MNDKPNITDLVILHDKELAKLKRAIPAIRDKMRTELSQKIDAVGEKMFADLVVRQGATADLLGQAARKEVSGRIGEIKDEITKLAEDSLAKLLVTHTGKLAEMWPQVSALAKEAASQVTREYAADNKGLSEVIRKELAALPSVGSELVKANKGNWKAGVVYNSGDIIFFRGSSYLVLRTSVRGEFPTAQNQNKPTAVYQILSAAGAPGPRGSETGGSSLPSMVGESGKFLTNNGTTASWATLAGGGDLLAANNLSDVANAATARTNLGLAIGTNVQAYDADLTTWAGITPAAGVGTFLATPSSANLAAAVTDETGSGALVFANTPTLVTPVLGVATATSVNKVAITAPATSATLTVADGKTLTATETTNLNGQSSVGLPETFIVSLSDMTTALTTGTTKAYFYAPWALTVVSVRATVATAPTGSALQVDINEAGVSILSTKITIDAGETDSATAATPPVISDTALAANALIAFDIDAVGSTIAGAGLEVHVLCVRA